MEIVDRKQMIFRKRLSTKLKPYLEQLQPEKVLRIDVAAEGCTIGGIRYVLNAWNHTHPKKQLYMKVEDSRKNPIVYIFES